MNPKFAHRHSILLAATVLLAALAPASAQTPIAITNSGFEDPVVTDGNLSGGSIPGWSAFNGGTLAVLNPSSVTDLTAEAPVGQNVGLITSSSNEDGMSQTLVTQFQADTSYTLSVKVANTKITSGFPGYRIQLAAGGTILAEEDNTQTAIEDSVVTATVNYTYNAGLHAGVVGQALEIRLLSKGLLSGQEIAFDDVQLTLSLPNPVASSGGPYTVLSGTSLLLDGSGSLPSGGATITAYDWDLNNDDIFGDVSGATPAAITYADLAGIWGMGLGANTIKLRVTDSAAKTAVATTTVTRQINANLSNMVPSAGSLAPAFAGGTTSYTALVSNATTEVTVTPTVANALATVTVNGNTVASGGASGPISLSVGDTTITTVVTGEDAVTTKTYTLTVTRIPINTGAWHVDSNGLWSEPANWVSGIADGSGFTARFANDITADRTVSLDSDRTLTNVVFGDSDTGTAGSWILYNNGTSTNNLILAGTTPTITVNALGTDKTATISAVVEGTAGLTKAGTGTLVLSGANTYTGGTSINSGTVVSSYIAGTPTINSMGSSAVSVASGATLQINRSGNANTTIPNTFTGIGTLVLNHNIPPGTTGRNTDMIGVTGFNGTIRLTNSASNGHKWRINGNLTVPGSLVVESGSTLYMSSGTSTATFAGGITVSGTGNTENRGALRLVGTLAGPVTLAGSTTIGAGGGRISGAVTSGAAGTQTITIGTNASGGGDAGNFTISGAIGGGTGVINLLKPFTSNNLNGILTLSGANTYTGTTTVNVGTLALGANNVLPDTSEISIGAATLNAATFTDTLGTLAVTSPSAKINLGTGAALAFADSSDVDWTGGGLDITGTFVSGVSIRFGTSAAALTSTQLNAITVNGSGAGTYTLNSSGFLVSASSAYDTWKAANAPGSTPQDDTDGDGVTNAVEFVLGGTSATKDLDKLPVFSTSGANVTFTFQRAVSSIDPKTAVLIETSTDLVTWTTAPSPYTVPDTAVANNPGVTVVEDTSVGFDTVTLTVPQAPDTRKFARLKVGITE